MRSGIIAAYKIVHSKSASGEDLPKFPTIMKNLHCSAWDEYETDKISGLFLYRPKKYADEQLYEDLKLLCKTGKAQDYLKAEARLKTTHGEDFSLISWYEWEHLIEGNGLVESQIGCAGKLLNFLIRGRKWGKKWFVVYPAQSKGIFAKPPDSGGIPPQENVTNLFDQLGIERFWNDELCFNFPLQHGDYWTLVILDFYGKKIYHYDPAGCNVRHDDLQEKLKYMRDFLKSTAKKKGATENEKRRISMLCTLNQKFQNSCLNNTVKLTVVCM